MKTVNRLCLTLALLLLLLPGCAKTTGAEREDGLRFLNPGGMRGYRFLEFLGEDDVWENGVCVAYLNDVTVSELTVPASYQGRTVVAAVGGSNEITDLKLEEGIRFLENMDLRSLKSVEIPSSVTFMSRAFDFCRDLEEVVIPGDVGRIEQYSFWKCESLKSVDFTGRIGTVQDSFQECPSLCEVVFHDDLEEILGASFAECPALKTIELPADTAVSDDAFMGPFEYDPAYSTEEVLSYAGGFDTEPLLAFARSVLGTEFSPEKKIYRNNAADFADRLNGPFVAADRCPDCHYLEYSVNTLPQNAEVHAIGVNEIDFYYRGTVYTEEKAEAVSEGRAPLCWCLYEYTGYADGPDYTLGSDVTDFLAYRVSLWDMESGDLIAWYNGTAGDAPFSYTVGKDVINFSLSVGDGGTKYFFRNEDGSQPTPLGDVVRDLYGLTARTTQTEIVRRDEP